MKEQRLIGLLALKGRAVPGSDRGRNPVLDRSRNPVLVLTSTELLAMIGIPQCWEDLPVPAKHIANGYRGFQSGYEGIQELADSLQQMYLGIESYSIWFEKERAKRRREENSAPKRPPTDHSSEINAPGLLPLRFELNVQVTRPWSGRPATFITTEMMAKNIEANHCEFLRPNRRMDDEFRGAVFQ